MTPQELAEAYLGALGRADLAAMLGLFSDGALVHSPLYGPALARDFFPALFGDTAQARLTLRGVTQGATPEGTPLVSIWFRFDWRLPSGQQAPFDVVDVLELAPGDRIAAMHIVIGGGGATGHRPCPARSRMPSTPWPPQPFPGKLQPSFVANDPNLATLMGGGGQDGSVPPPWPLLKRYPKCCLMAFPLRSRHVSARGAAATPIPPGAVMALPPEGQILLTVAILP